MTASLPIAETFTSLQGEGKLTGVPSWFVRLSGCNLRCAWCDTPHASWSPEQAPRAIADLIAEGRGSGVHHAVVTGGEPMMFPGVVELTRGLAEAGLHVTIETAGTIDQPVHADLLSISPKLSSSTPPADDGTWARGEGGVGVPEGSSSLGPISLEWVGRHEQRRLNYGVLAALLGRYPERQLKFVISEPSRDLGEIDDVLSRLTPVDPGDILLMPEGISAPSARLRQSVIDICVQRGWRYCHRLHIELFGHRRGT